MDTEDKEWGHVCGPGRAQRGRGAGQQVLLSACSVGPGCEQSDGKGRQVLKP